VNKLSVVIIIGIMGFISCKNQNSTEPTGSISKKEYSIIFGNANVLLNEQYALGIINSDGTGLKKIDAGVYDIYSFSVTDDGLTAVYLYTSTASPYITVSNITNMTKYQISDSEKAAFPTVSPNGAYIACKLFGEYGLNLMNIDGSNKKKIITQKSPNYFKWSSDSKGIIYAFDYSSSISPKPAYYVDKDGINNPVEVENPYVQYGIVDYEFYSLNQFTRAGLSNLTDSAGFLPIEFNKQKNKAWSILSINISSRNFKYILLGYDFNKKTEKVLIDSSEGWNPSLSSSITWSPNDEDIAVFTKNGIEIVKVDGSRNKILSCSLIQTPSINYKWIPRSN
jgi:hypothetical protein